MVHAKKIEPAAIEGEVLSSTRLLKIALIAINSDMCLILVSIGRFEQYLSIKSIGLDDSDLKISSVLLGLARRQFSLNFLIPLVISCSLISKYPAISLVLLGTFSSRQAK